MGSKIVTAIVHQVGSLSANPEDLSPSTSRPIEQLDNTPSTSSKPIHQLITLSTDDDFSAPIEQILGATFSSLLSNPDDTILEQIKTERLTEDENKDTPIEQKVFVTSNLRADSPATSKLVEQRILSRSSAGDEPLEQKPRPSNQIDITQYEFAELIFPPCNSIKNPVTANILWRIRDFGFSFDIETLVFKVNGIEVQDSSNFSVTAITNGLQLDYDPPEPFDYDSTVRLVLEISDNASPPNEFFYRCSWQTVQDSNPPVISLVSPTCNSIGVGVDDPVVFDVLDVGEGIDQDSIQFYVEGITVCSGLSFDPLTTASGSGFRVTWSHTDDPFRYESDVTVAIQATDLSPLENSTLFVCSFQTESSNLPDFMNFDPEPCETVVDNTTGLVFEVYGNIDGVDITTLEVRIDKRLRKVFVRPRILRSE